MRKWKRHQTSQHLVGISFDHGDGSVGSHASRSLNRCESCCDVVRAAMGTLRRGPRRGAAIAGRLRCSSASGQTATTLGGACWPRRHAWHCWQVPGTVGCRRWPRRIGIAVNRRVSSTARLDMCRRFRGCWLSRCFGGAEHRVAGMGSARLVRRGAWPAMVVAARGRGAAARAAASRLLCGSVVAAEAGVRGPPFIRRGSCAAAKACSPAAGAAGARWWRRRATQRQCPGRGRADRLIFRVVSFDLWH